MPASISQEGSCTLFDGAGSDADELESPCVQPNGEVQA